MPFWTIISTFKSEYAMYCYTPCNMKAYQPNINYSILTKKSTCKPLVTISSL